MASYTSRNRVDIASTVDSKALLKRYENMLSNVTNMINKDGYIYSVWIYFQIGLNDKNAITFNTASTNPKQNLIASLNIDKTGAGVANSFTLVIQYDPFNYGQDTTDDIEKLEEFIATAMSEDFDSANTSCRGKLQYGYNSTSDSNLVSPLYEFFLTSASTNVKFDSGIVTYTFTGTSTIAADCDYTTSYPAVKQKKVLQVVGETLYKYYGDSTKKPSFITDETIVPEDNDYKYIIDINPNLIEKSVEIDYDEVKSDTMSPIVYCKTLLDANPLTQEEKDSGLYDDLDEKSINLQPRWVISITDQSGASAIHIAHAVPKSSKVGKTETYTEKSDLKINYKFTWGVRSSSGSVVKSIVLGWNPEVDLYTYLIRKSLFKRQARLKELADQETETNGPYKQKYDEVVKSIKDDLREMYNAELQLIGIPADPPLTAEIEIHPKILENESRTAGIYMITGATDSISTQGTYTSILKLFRLRSTDANLVEQNNTKEDTGNATVYTTSTAPAGFVGPVLPDKNSKQASSNSYVRTKQPSEIEKVLANGGFKLMH